MYVAIWHTYKLLEALSIAKKTVIKIIITFINE